MWLVTGFGTLGLLLGFLLGMTSESLVGSTIALLFAFVGGTVFAVLGKLSDPDRKLAGKIVFALALCCLGGVAVGVAVDHYRLLSPHPSQAQTTYKDKDNPYLRNSTTAIDPDSIDAERVQGILTPDQAYEQMYKLAKSQKAANGK